MGELRVQPLACRSGAVPLAAVRGRDDELRAFVNVCRHRGHEVVTGDGRRETLSMARSVVGTVVTHVYLHDGPKIETRYRLGRTEDGQWVYSLIDDLIDDDVTEGVEG